MVRIQPLDDARPAQGFEAPDVRLHMPIDVACQECAG